MAEVLAKSVSKIFPNGEEGLREIDLHVASGDFVTLLGPSGCGKSTLLRLIAGLSSVSEGSIHVQGLPPADARRRWHRAAFVFQEPNLLPWRSVRANIGLPLELQGVGRRERDAQVDAILALVGLAQSDAAKRPAMLSGGMRMRVSLARALVTQPDLMLLDEPFAALDDLLRTRLNEELLRIWHAQRWTGIFVTHNIAEAVYLSQRVVIMSQSPGRTIAEIEIPLSSPRTQQLRTSQEFAATCGMVLRALEEADDGYSA